MRNIILSFLLVAIPSAAFAEHYECKGFEPSFTLTLSKEEITLGTENASQVQHLSPVTVEQGNNARLYSYRVSRNGNPDFVAILEETGSCQSDLNGTFTHHMYFTDGRGVADGCCILKK